MERAGSKKCSNHFAIACLFLNKFAGQNCLVPSVTCLSLVKPREKWFKHLLTRHASTRVPGQTSLNHLFSKIVVDEWFKGLLGHHMLVPINQHLGSGCLGFPTWIVIIYHWFPALPAPKISIRDPPALAFRHGSGSVVILNNGGVNIKKQISPCRTSLEESSGQFRHGSGSVVTPPVTSRSQSVSRDLSFIKNG